MEERLRVFMDFAMKLAALSKCEQRGVAALLVDSKLQQIISIGVNGGASGSHTQCLCTLGPKFQCVHAEINMLVKCESSPVDKVAICTLAPCPSCAAAMINAGISAVYYHEAWKYTEGLQLLIEAGIYVQQV